MNCWSLKKISLTDINFGGNNMYISAVIHNIIITMNNNKNENNIVIVYNK